MMRPNFNLWAVVLDAFVTVASGLEYCSDTVSPYEYGVDLGVIDVSSQSQLEFISVGDWGVVDCASVDCNASIARRVIASINEHYNSRVSPSNQQASFFVSLGDHFYENGVDSISDERWNTSYEALFTFEGASSSYLNTVPMYAVLGNHAYLRNALNVAAGRTSSTWDNGCTSEIYYTRNNAQKRWCMPSYFYTFTYQLRDFRTYFIGIDTDIWTTCFAYESTGECKGDSIPSIERQWQWLEQTLAGYAAARNTSDRIIVFAHHPVISVGADGLRRSGVCANISYSPLSSMAHTYMLRMMALFEAHGVDLFISGHEHSSQILVGQRKQYDDSGYEMVQLITGAMGNVNGATICGDQGDIEAQYNGNANVTLEWTLQFAQMQPGFGAVVVDNTSVNVSIYGVDDTRLFSYVLQNEPRTPKGHMFRVIQIVIIALVIVVVLGAIIALSYYYCRNKRAQHAVQSNQELRASLVE